MDNFDWDEFKNIENKKKHGLWFEETLAAFDDPHGQQIEDKNTVGEQRFILLAQNGFNQIFVVIYSYEDSLPLCLESWYLSC